MVNFKSLSSNRDKNTLLLRITCLCWFFAKLLGWRIWTTNRLLPTAPLLECFNAVPNIVHTILFGLSILFIVLLFLKNNKLLLIGLLGVEISLCFLDQSRLLPWEYQYTFILIIFIINANTPKLIPAAVTFILIATYTYSGLYKFNENFLQIVWDHMILKLFFKLPATFIAQSWVHYSGYLLGAIELLGGLGLLFVKTQLKSAMILILMHFFVLLLLGPFGFRGYRVLWPWNISMILFLCFLFLEKGEEINVFKSATIGWNKLVFICWGILPALGFIGYWDNNLSSNLFSANVPKMIICVSDTSKCKELQRFCKKKDIPNTCRGLAKIDIQTWAMVETGVSIYPEIRVYKIIQHKLEKQYAAAGLSFVYLPR